MKAPFLPSSSLGLVEIIVVLEAPGQVSKTKLACHSPYLESIYGSSRSEYDVWVCVCVCSVAQLFLTLCNTRDYSPPGSSVCGISQARILEWVAISSSRGSPQSRDQINISYVSHKSSFEYSWPLNMGMNCTGPVIQTTTLHIWMVESENTKSLIWRVECNNTWIFSCSRSVPLPAALFKGQLQ